MKEWIKAHIWSFFMVAFSAGILYSQVSRNTTELEKNRSDSVRIALMEQRVGSLDKTLTQLLASNTAQYKEFLDKLDAVIVRLDKRDAAQTEIINGMLVEVSVLKERIREGKD